MNLLLIGHAIHPNPDRHEGVKAFASLLARQLSADGHRCSVLSIDSQAQRSFRRFCEDGVRHYVIKRGSSRWDLEKWTLRWIAARRRADAVLAFGALPRRLPSTWRGRTAVWIYRYNGIDRMAPGPGVLLIAEHPTLAAALRAAHPANEVVEIPPCVDVEVFTRRSFAPGGDRLRVFFASSPLPKHEPAEVEARYLERRGVHALLDLIDALGPEGPLEVELLWRKDPTHIRALTRDFPGVVRVEDAAIADMNAYLERFDFCAAFFQDAEDSKAIPQSCLEALAKGIPLLSLRGTALGDLVEKSGAGLALDRGDWLAAKASLDHLRAHPDAYVSLSQAARALAERHYAPAVVAARLVEVLSP
jgi:glycosyltransferase involved in cell wall biosynthesis